MEIIKGDNRYSIIEHSDKWSVKLERGKLGVSFSISKELCATEDELRKYVLSNEMF